MKTIASMPVGAKIWSDICPWALSFPRSSQFSSSFAFGISCQMQAMFYSYTHRINKYMAKMEFLEFLGDLKRTSWNLVQPPVSRDIVLACNKMKHALLFESFNNINWILSVSHERGKRGFSLEGTLSLWSIFAVIFNKAGLKLWLGAIAHTLLNAPRTSRERY